MVASELDHVGADGAEKVHVARAGAEYQRLLGWVGRRAVRVERQLIGDMGEVGGRERRADVLGGVKDAHRLHGVRGAADHSRHASHHEDGHIGGDAVRERGLGDDCRLQEVVGSGTLHADFEGERPLDRVEALVEQGKTV